MIKIMKNLKGNALIFLFSISISVSVSAGWISAAEFRLGENVTEVFENVTLNWIKSVKDEPRQYLPSIISQDPRPDFEGGLFHDKYFGSAIGAASYSTINLIHGNPVNPGSFEALSITFDQPTQFFGYKAENHSNDPMMIALYDTSGVFIDWIAEGPSSRTRNDAGHLISDFSYSYDFGFDVGSIILGGTDSASYIYALALVPEPSSMLLMVLGLLSLGVARKLKLSRTEKSPDTLA
ncbi:MAG: PEP-CTERM sorting domain-containing protein [Pseudomonadota bacterium]